MLPLCTRTQVRPAATAPLGHHIMLQGFHWRSSLQQRPSLYEALLSEQQQHRPHYYSAIWLPPPSKSVSPEGYLPQAWYELDSCYGTGSQLQQLNAALADNGVVSIADVVLNHRCADAQDSSGKWNVWSQQCMPRWDASALCRGQPQFGGTGAHKAEAYYGAAPNVDHSSAAVRGDVKEWLAWLQQDVGFQGLRFDFVRGFAARHVQEYVTAARPRMAVAEHWETCCYDHNGVLEFDQNRHRQSTIDWIDGAGGSCSAFDFTTRGVLKQAAETGEMWRLRDREGRAPGVVGWWPSRAVTFVSNHDVEAHWPVHCWQHKLQMYAYILTHPGTPCVFCLDASDPRMKEAIDALAGLRRKFDISSGSTLEILEARQGLYVARVGGRLLVKLGADCSSWSPPRRALLLAHGEGFAVWAV